MANKGNPWDGWHRAIMADPNRTKRQKEDECMLAEMLRITDFVPYFPFSPMQVAVLLATEREVMAGGQAGAGKTDAAMIKALISVQYEDYLGTFFRESEKQLIDPGGLKWQYHRWLRPFMKEGRVVWNEESRTYYFPETNASIGLGYMGGPGDEDNYVGVPRIHFFWGELTRYKFRFDALEGKDQWNPYQFLVRSQRKNLAMPIDPQTFSDTNPGGPSEDFVRHYFLPDPPAGLRKDIPNSESYLIWQPPDPQRHFGGRIYIHGIRRENPGIDHASYDVSEALADPITRRQQFEGEWGVVVAGDMFDVTKIKRVPFVPPTVMQRRRAWDKAYTQGGTRDRTAGVRISRLAPGVALALWGQDFAKVEFVVEHVIAGRWGTEVRENNIDAIAAGGLVTLDSGAKLDWAGDGTGTFVTVEQERGGGKESAEITVARLIRNHFVADYESVKGDKVSRAHQVAAAVNNGMYAVVDNQTWDVMDFLNELRAFPNGKTDDEVDAARIANDKLVRVTPGVGPRAALPTPQASGFRPY
jgi:predicted phage terminase large subunit-like protein